MITAVVPAEDDFDAWRDAARGLAAAGTPPGEIVWQVGENRADLFAGTLAAIEPAQFSVPRAFVEMAQSAICHSDPERFGLLYTLLFELCAGRKRMEDAADPLIRRIFEMAKAVRRDIHKMRAFVRFRCVDPGSEAGAGDHYIAWFEPEHHIVRANTGFFVRRFASMRWSILTPELSIHWDCETLSEGPPGRKEDAPTVDAVEDQWRAYYASIFNPARLKVKAMLKEMPKKYWHNMPETTLVPGLIKTAQAREVAMIEKSRAEVAEAPDLRIVHDEAHRCKRCPLYAPATQVVFGEGPDDAPLMFVGEQPGDQEDLAGRPFVGPAGQVFERALAAAGIERDRTYVTNAVKHFKFVLRGKRRIHDKPNAGEIDACRWWLKREIDIVQPDLIVALGATALRSLTGKPLSITKARGADIRSLEGVPVLATVHPSYLLRLPDAEDAEREEAAFVRDLRAARERVLVT